MITKARTSWKFYSLSQCKNIFMLSQYLYKFLPKSKYGNIPTHAHTPLLSKNAIFTQHHGAGCVFFHFTILSPHASRIFGKWGWHCRSKSGFGLGQSKSKSKYVKVKLNTSECKGPQEERGVQTVGTRYFLPMLPDEKRQGPGPVPLHFYNAGHYPPSNYGPTYPCLGFSYLNTLVDCLLHQMHLMPSDVIQPCPRTGPVLAVDCQTCRVP